jgi:AraC-like DNA-binding protein
VGRKAVLEVFIAEDFEKRLSHAAHESERGAWRMAFLKPTERLAPFVTRFNAYREHDTAFTRRCEPPTGSATLVFNLGEELRVEHPTEGPSAYRAGGAFYTGVSTRHAVTETDSAQAGAQAMLTPLGARLLLDFPLNEVGDLMIDPRDLFGALARETVDRLQGRNAEESRLAILEAMIEQRLATARRKPPRDLAHAAQRLQASGGRIAIADLAAEIGCSRKHLTVRFTREFGIAPKALCRVLRFDRALHALRDGALSNIAELADFCGYSDQAHLTRDFTEFVGAPPAAFMRRALPDNGGFAL